MSLRLAAATVFFVLPVSAHFGGEPGVSRQVVAGLAEAGPGSTTPATIQTNAGPTPPPVAPAPAINWVLPLFSDKEGHRTMTLRGAEARPVGKTIVVTNLSITTFSGDAAAKVESILLSPHAVYFPKENNRASGDQTVRFIQDDVEVTGTGWTYDHAAKKVSLREKVRVTFRVRLNDILK